MKKINISKDFLDKEYINNKKTIYEIAKILDCSRVTILNYLKKYGLNNPRDKYSNILTKKFLIKEYVKEDKSVFDISKNINCGFSIVYHYLKKYNIKSKKFRGKEWKKYYCKCGNEVSGLGVKMCMDCYKLFQKESKNNPMYNKHHSLKACEKIRKKALGRISPFKDKIRPELAGSNNPNFNNWSSREPYAKEWSLELKDKIRKRDNYECQNCSMTEEEHLIVIGRNLSTHHIDYNKKNSQETNLITLCNWCNARANSNRNYWKEFYKNKMEAKNVFKDSH